ncbi:hypothetical protein DL767_004469 [Monosporascus sp. MG133]|nr:hypothetical protein DL767_004469 [Monosporascus sp. MG133]
MDRTSREVTVGMAVLEELANATIAKLVPPQEGIHERYSSQSDPNNSKLVSIMVISLSLASVSVIAALTAFYMFVRMRRSFHHDLVMLLIQSDMMKAFWLVVCPIVYFAKGQIHSSDTFCQVSGFFLAVAIEAADIAALMIALHTVLTLLLPHRFGAEIGLYPYRRVAYLCWAVVPVVMASIVPISGGMFVDDGPKCYLPISPTWYRLTLSWIPRYIFFGIIFLTYGGAYLYVRLQLRQFRQFQRGVSRASGRTLNTCFSGGEDHQRHRESRVQSVPGIPPIADHGLLAPDQADGRAAEDQGGRHFSTASTIAVVKHPTVPKPVRWAGKRSVSWKPVNFNQKATPTTSSGPQDVDIDPIDPINNYTIAESATLQPSDGTQLNSSINPNSPPSSSPNLSPNSSPNSSTPSKRPSAQSSSSHSRSFWRRPISLPSLASSVHNILDILRRGPPAQPGPSPSSIYLPHDETEAMRRSREHTQRQLRLLFVYPAIYVLTWVAPLVSHVLGLMQRRSSGGGGGSGFLATDPGTPSSSLYDYDESFGLQVASIASLCVGAAVDCCFFSAWEKPWRHLQRGFREGLATRFHLRLRLPTGASGARFRRDSHHGGIGGGRRYGGGRTREERNRDARLAQVRRDREALEHLAEAAVTAMRPKRAAPREWWEVVDVDYGGSGVGNSTTTSNGQSAGPGSIHSVERE